jgi:hypothetical protein
MPRRVTIRHTVEAAGQGALGPPSTGMLQDNENTNQRALEKGTPRILWP